jgi:cysteinyl-tRNA synthetase
VSAAGRLRSTLSFLGLYEERPSIELLAQDVDSGLEAKVEILIAARLEARKRKDFKEGDRIRDELASMGIQLKDSKNKETGEIETTWEVKR